ncbi:hypothetical protein LCER1_G009276, partial [Lachnellula cervina]
MIIFGLQRIIKIRMFLRKICKIIISLKYSQENRRLLKIQINALKIKDSRMPQLKVAKLCKYYPKATAISNSNKAIFLALILDPRIRKDGLENIGFSSRVVTDIKTHLKADFN